MEYLILSVACSVLIANLLKLFTRDKNAPILIIFAGNYLFASIISRFLVDGGLSATKPFDIVTGAFTGLLLLVCFLMYEKNIQKNGMSLSVSVMRSSLLIPILFALFMFGETVNMFNYSGIGLILLTFFLMSGNQSPANLVLILALFTIAGLTDSFFKIYNVYGSNSEALFLFYSFSAAFLLNVALIIREKIPFQLKYFIYGIILGIPNQLTAYFFMKSLKVIPAALAYPMLSANIVLFSLISDKLVWKSKFSKKQSAIFSMMLIGVILLNVGR